jgi:hypothetical protein
MLSPALGIMTSAPLVATVSLFAVSATGNFASAFVLCLGNLAKALRQNAAIVAGLITMVNKTMFMRLIYLLVAFGIVASHVTAIAMAIANA